MGKTPETFSGYFEQLPANKQAVVKQYQSVAGAHNALQAEIYARTRYKEWEIDGVGSCNVDPMVADEGIIELNLLELRERREFETPGESECCCPYHRPGVGCILGDLKSSKCLDHIPYFLKMEVDDKFGITIPRIGKVLDTIQSNHDAPEESVELVNSTIKKLIQLTDHVKTFPEQE